MIHHVVRDLKGISNMKFSLLLSCVFSVCIGFARVTNYWVGSSGNWSDTSKWYMDAAGTVRADRYPGAVTSTVDGVELRATDDVVHFTSTATGTITLDDDVSIYHFKILASPTETTMTFESDPENPKKLTLTTKVTSSISGDTSIAGKRTAIFRNIEVKGISFDCRGGDVVFDAGSNIEVGRIIAWD